MTFLREGSKVAEAKAAETLKDVKASMRINYFDDDSFDSVKYVNFKLTFRWLWHILIVAKD